MMQAEDRTLAMVDESSKRETERSTGSESTQEILSQFQGALKSGASPKLEDFIAGTDEPQQSALLRQLLSWELAYRIGNGEQPTATEYLPRFPQHGDLITQVLAQTIPETIDISQTDSRGDGNGDTQPVVVNDPEETVILETPDVQTDEAVEEFGDYRLLERIASGGMGVVYKAHQQSLNRIVAVKMILSGSLANENDVTRFRAEAEAAANLDHPNIVSIFEVGEHAGRHFFSMGFVEGSSLTDAVRNNLLPPEQAAEILRTVAEATEYAHQQGILHRDLKPSNVLLDRQGQPQITDFGLAKRLEGESDLTATGQILGTPSYMPPEQAQGDHQRVGPASDVYSLGAILYELLTGRPPFRAENAVETLRQVVDTEPVSPRLLNPQIPMDLETICFKCLSKEPQQRYPSAKELADELARFHNGVPILARPISRPARVWRWCRRNRIVAGLLATVAASLLIGTAVATYFALEARSGEEAAVDAAEKYREQTKRAVKAESKARTAEADAKAKEADAVANAARATRERDKADANLHVVRMLLAATKWRDAQIGQLKSDLEAARPQPGQVDYRGWDWYYLTSLCNRDLSTVSYGSGASMFSRLDCAAWSPDGRWIATSKPHGPAGLANLHVTNSVTGGEEFTHLIGLSNIEALAWNPGQTQIAALDLLGLSLFDMKARKIERFNVGVKAFLGATLSWNSDGKRIAICSFDPVAKIWDVPGEKELLSLELEGYAMGLAWDPSDERLATISMAGDDDPFEGLIIEIWDTENGKRLHNLRAHSERRGCLAWSPDGKTLATAADDGQIVFWDPTDGRQLQSIRAHNAPVDSLAWSVDSQQIASGSGDHTIKVWDARTGKLNRTLRGHVKGVSVVSWSPDGTRLASASEDMTIKTWDASAAQDVTDRNVDLFDLEGQQYFLKLRWSPNGKWIALEKLFWSPDRKKRQFGVAVVNSESLAPVFEKVFDEGVGHGDIAWSSDSRRLGFLKLPQKAEDGAGSRLGLWNPETNTIVDSPRISAAYGYGVSLALSSDLTRLAAVETAGTLRHNRTIDVWDVTSGKQQATLRGHTQDVTAVSWTPDNSRLVSVGKDQRVFIWNATTWKAERVLLGHKQELEAIDISPDGKWIASSGEPNTRIWELASGRHVRTLFDVRHVAFSHDSRRVIGQGSKEITIFDTETWQPLATLGADSSLTYGPEWSPDGKRILTLARTRARAGSGRVHSATDPPRTIQLWDPLTGHAVHSLHTEKSGQLRSPAFSPDGKKIAAMAGSSLKLWDATVGYAIEESGGTPDATHVRIAKLVSTRNPQRRAAEVVLGFDGSVKVSVDDAEPVQVKRLCDLPRKRFRVTEVHLRRKGEFTDEYLPLLAELDLVYLSLSQTGVTGACIEHVDRMKDLEHLHLNNIPLTDELVGRLAHLDNLVQLGLLETGLSDAAVIHLQKLVNLESLWLGGNQISDAGLKNLTPLEKLTHLAIQELDLTDKCIDDLVKFKALRTLLVTDTQITADGVRRLKEAIPDCRVSWGPYDDNRILANYFTRNRGRFTFAVAGEEIERASQAGGYDFTYSGPFELREIEMPTGMRFGPTDLGRLAGLSQLRRLSFHGNPIIDADLTHLTSAKVTELDLGETGTSDAGLASVAQMESLRSLSLEGTKVTDKGLASIVSLPKLEQLRLSYTEVSDAGLEHLRQLSSLKKVWLDHTAVTDAKVQSLQDSMPGCQFIRVDPERKVGQWVLDLGGKLDVVVRGKTVVVEFGGQLPAGPFRVVDIKLDELDSIQDDDLHDLPVVPRLSSINLRLTDVSDRCLQPLSRFESLRSLDLSRTKVVSLQGIDAFVNLTRLSLGGTKLDTTGFTNLSKMQNLQSLTLAGTQATSERLKQIAKLKNLKYLHLGYSKIETAAIGNLRPLAVLEDLVLEHTDIKDDDLHHLGDMQSLKTINLSNTSITDDGLKHLDSLQNLRKLDLTETKTTAAGIDSFLRKRPDCQIESDRSRTR